MHTPSYPTPQAPTVIPPPPAFGLGKLPPPKKSTTPTFLGVQATPTSIASPSLMSGSQGKSLLGQ